MSGCEAEPRRSTTPTGGRRQRKRGRWDPWAAASAGGSEVIGSGGAVASSDWATAPSSSPDLTVADADVLDCGVCFLPLKPPIFQCEVGHVVCSPCHGKLSRAGKCHVCGVAMPGGYRRCHAMERVVESVTARCPNAAYGCKARLKYPGNEDHHARKCRHAPCHCPGGEACGFAAGSTAALLDHITSAHGWPSESKSNLSWSCTWSIRLRLGFNFIVIPDDDDTDDKYLFLLNLTRRRSSSRAVSVICIRPLAAARKGITFKLSYSCGSRSDSHHHHQETVFTVDYSDLSDGLPDPDDPHQLNVPNYVHGDDDRDDMDVSVTISEHQWKINCFVDLEGRMMQGRLRSRDNGQEVSALICRKQTMVVLLDQEAFDGELSRVCPARSLASWSG